MIGHVLCSRMVFRKGTTDHLPAMPEANSKTLPEKVTHFEVFHIFVKGGVKKAWGKPHSNMHPAICRSSPHPSSRSTQCAERVQSQDTQSKWKTAWLGIKCGWISHNELRAKSGYFSPRTPHGGITRNSNWNFILTGSVLHLSDSHMTTEWNYRQQEMNWQIQKINGLVSSWSLPISFGGAFHRNNPICNLSRLIFVPHFRMRYLANTIIGKWECFIGGCSQKLQLKKRKAEKKEFFNPLGIKSPNVLWTS